MNTKNYLKEDTLRYIYIGGQIPAFQKYFRKCQETMFFPLKMLYKILFKIYKKFYLIDMSVNCQIDGGLYFGHPYCISINSKAVIGKNVNIHKGVTIGQENRGIRKGTPTIGNNVWIGINSTIVGKITIGDDVLIAPNAFVNTDIPSHSIVIGNPCIIKSCENATKDYINNPVP